MKKDGTESENPALHLFKILLSNLRLKMYSNAWLMIGNVPMKPNTKEHPITTAPSSTILALLSLPSIQNACNFKLQRAISLSSGKIMMKTTKKRRGAANKRGFYISRWVCISSICGGDRGGIA